MNRPRPVTVARQDGWNGFGLIRPGWTLYVGGVGAAREHAHHAIQIVVSDDSLVLRDGSGRTVRTGSAVIPASYPHAVVEGCRLAAMLFVEPEGAVGRAIASGSSGSTESAEAWVRTAERLRWDRLSPPGPDRPEHLITEILTALGVDTSSYPRATIHPALERATGLVAATLDGPVNLQDVAAEVGLSASRLRHLFAEQLGLSFRRFVLWLRLQRAAEEVLSGATLTDAAHAAGFADSSHLSNVTRETFGLTPSTLARALADDPSS
ncbi:helix-turn-helix transcriptional regulator [Aeromicrobium sp. CTD01-1L150]|uniref:helix-turn-helix transcriptional regulator n=1 Tax=Aeromicrobium sp. CTD01-1L150 TaxID=3341830 RepID=UPI0035C1A630